jgi:Metal-dependent hydrolase involved in phosphonate metabolism
VRIRDGLIDDVSEGRAFRPGALDCGGDFLIPGLVELHTDDLSATSIPAPASTGRGGRRSLRMTR